MLFKFSVLFLSFILAAKTVLSVSEDQIIPDQTEENILKDLYDDCRKWIGSFLEIEVSSSGFWMYMGKNKSDLNRMFDFYRNNPDVPHGHLEFEHFSELFKYICIDRGVSVKYWAAYRKANAALRTRDETALLHPDQTEDNIMRDPYDVATLSYSVWGKTDEEILKASFDNCRRWLGESLDSNISLTQFWVYMGKNEKDNDRISDFFIKNPDAYFRTSEYYIDNPDIIQGPIDLQLYSELFKHICSKIGVPVREWAVYRKIKTAARTLSGVMSLPLGDHDKAL